MDAELPCNDAKDPAPTGTMAVIAVPAAGGARAAAAALEGVAAWDLVAASSSKMRRSQTSFDWAALSSMRNESEEAEKLVLWLTRCIDGRRAEAFKDD